MANNIKSEISKLKKYVRQTSLRASKGATLKESTKKRLSTEIARLESLLLQTGENYDAIIKRAETYVDVRRLELLRKARLTDDELEAMTRGVNLSTDEENFSQLQGLAKAVILNYDLTTSDMDYVLQLIERGRS